MARTASTSRRKPRLRTELSEADEQRLQQAAALFGLPKAEVVRRLIRASVQTGPAHSAENTQAVILLAGQVRMVGRNLMQVLKAIHRGQAVRIEVLTATRFWMHCCTIQHGGCDVQILYRADRRNSACVVSCSLHPTCVGCRNG